MLLDLHSSTLALVICLIAPLLAVGNLVVWRQTEEAAMLWWAAGNLAVGASAMLRVLPASPFGDGMILIALALCFHLSGIRHFQRRAGRGTESVFITATGTLVLLGFMLASPVGEQSAAWLPAAVAGLSAACAFALMAHSGNLGRGASRFVGSLFAVNAFFFAFLGLHAAIAAPNPGLQQLLDIATQGEILTLFIGWNFGVVMMAMQRYLSLVIELANHDDLTGVLNRRAFGERARQHIDLARRGKVTLSVLALDLDHFKKVNDTYGHHAGDEVLRHFVKTAQSCLRSADLFCRVGGEEFVVLLPASRSAGALALAERLRQKFAEAPVRFRGNDISVTVSIGVAEYERRHEDLETLLDAADAALYCAKRRGRNCVEMAPQSGEALLAVELVWDARYLSGHSAIDAEHQDLIRMVNRLIGKAQIEPDVRSLHGELEELLFWLSEHFCHEESAFMPTGWSGADAHVSEHRKLEARGRELLVGIGNSDHTFAELLDFLIRDVVGTHLAQHDIGFFPFVRQPEH